MMDVIAMLAECIGRHVIAAKRDGMANALESIEKINEDAKAIHALAQGEPCDITLHGLK